MNAVTTGAVRDYLRASARCQPVITGQICGFAAAFDAKFLGEPHPFVAAGTCCLRQILRRNRRGWIEMRFDGVNPVAIGAHGSLPVPLGNSLSVDALFELF